MRSREETGAKMRKYRESRMIDLKMMSSKAKASGALLAHLESDNWITHPSIASRVCAAYELDVDDFNNLVHKSKRVTQLPTPVPFPKSSGYYD